MNQFFVFHFRLLFLSSAANALLGQEVFGILATNNGTQSKWTGLIQNLARKWSMNPECVNLFESALQAARNQTESVLECEGESCGDASSPPSWPLWMLDSWGRPLPGIHSRGPFFFLGHYDQCASLSQPNRTARYCRAEWNIEVAKQKVPLHYGFCLLKECEAMFKDREVISELRSKNIYVSCKDAQTKFVWSWDKIVYSSIVGFLVILIVFGTCLDQFNRSHFICSNLRRKEEPQYVAQNQEEISNEATVYETTLASSDFPSVALTYKPVEAVGKIFGTYRSAVFILRSFSIFLNINRLLRVPRLEIDSLHGIRVISAFWVVFGHSHLLPLAFVDNVQQMVGMLTSSSIYSVFVVNSTLAVDSFFLVSATIMSFVMHRKLRRAPNQGFLGFIRRAFILYLHRWIRLMPTYALVLGFTLTFFNHIGSGPVWEEQKGVFGSQCNASDWLKHLTFTVNAFPNQCMPWMWFLSVDFQLFLLSPIFFALLHISKNVGVIVLASGLLFVNIYRVLIIYFNDFPVNIAVNLVQQGGNGDLRDAEKMFYWLYANPVARASPYLIGLFLGWNIHSKTSTNFSLWLLRISSLLALLWPLFGLDLINHRIYEIVYGALYRTFWSGGLAIIIWLSHHNQFGFIGDFLNARQWVLFSRLGYGLYLTHELIIVYTVYTRRTAWTVHSLWELIQLTLSTFVLSQFLAFILSVLIELPPLNAERKLLMTVRGGDEEGQEEDNGMGEEVYGYRAVEMKEFEQKESLLSSDRSVAKMKSTESWVLSGKIDSEEFWDQYEPTPPNQPLQPSQMYHEINQTYHKLQRQKSQNPVTVTEKTAKDESFA